MAQGIYPWNEEVEKLYAETPDLECRFARGNKEIEIYFKSSKAKKEWEKKVMPVSKKIGVGVPVITESLLDSFGKD